MAALGRWLGNALEVDTEPRLEVVGGPTTAGFSSETILFDLVAGQDRSAYVLRLPPPADAFPLFPSYDLHRQVEAMRLVRRRTAVPVPDVPWFEPDAGPLGAPFFVMERVDGRAAPDMPPCVLDGWVLDTSPAVRASMEAGVIAALAGIHEIAGDGRDAAFLELDEPGETPLRRHLTHQRRYYDWIRRGRRFPMIDALFAWLAGHWPSHEGAPVVSWGDARVANVLFRDGLAVAILDWEAVASGPRELDLGWLLYFQDYFQRIARDYGFPGLPDFFEPDRVVGSYVQQTGYEPRHLDWYVAYAALRQGLTSIRVSERAVHFGEWPPPEAPDGLILDRAGIEGVLAS